jgi:hypothetical protein
MVDLVRSVRPGGQYHNLVLERNRSRLSSKPEAVYTERSGQAYAPFGRALELTPKQA